MACGYLAVQVADGKSLNRITSDRTNRVEDAVRVIENHPVAGVGIGGQPRASRRLAGSERPTPTFVSHTTPLTVLPSWARSASLYTRGCSWPAAG